MTDAECVDFLQWALPRMGLRWAGYRRVRRQVCKRLARRLRELGLPDLCAYRSHLESDPGEWAALDACCRITISRFHRDRGVFEDLETRVLPVLARAALDEGRQKLAAWSAGCASGEEPYSLRALWELRLARRFPGIGLHVVATDADPVLLERARRARYRASSLKDLRASWRPRMFEEREGAFQLRPELRRGVELRCEDMRASMPPGPFDLILCRNLAFTYFAEELQREILTRLAERLLPGGAMVLGAHESLPAPALGFAPWPHTRNIHHAPTKPGDGPCFHRGPQGLH